MVSAAALWKARQVFLAGEVRVGLLPVVLTPKSTAFTASQSWRPLVARSRPTTQIRAMSRSALEDTKDGEFKRTPSAYRNFISSEPGTMPQLQPLCFLLECVVII